MKSSDFKDITHATIEEIVAAMNQDDPRGRAVVKNGEVHVRLDMIPCKGGLTVSDPKDDGVILKGDVKVEGRVTHGPNTVWQLAQGGAEFMEVLSIGVGGLCLRGNHKVQMDPEDVEELRDALDEWGAGQAAAFAEVVKERDAALVNLSRAQGEIHVLTDERDALKPVRKPWRDVMGGDRVVMTLNCAALYYNPDTKRDAISTGFVGITDDRSMDADPNAEVEVLP